MLKTGRREMPDLMPGRAYRPSRMEFFVVLSEIRVNMGSDPLKRPPWRALPQQTQVPQAKNWPESNNPTQLPTSVMSHPSACLIPLQGHILLNGYCELCMFLC